MNDRRDRILNRLAESGESSPDGLCAVCMDVTATSGVGIMLMAGAAPHGSVGMTNAVSALIEELQFTLGEGPGIDAYNLGLPIAEPDLANPTTQWPGFTPPVFDAGVRAIFAFPLQVGAVCIGALDLYRDRAGALSDDQHADALFIAVCVAQALLTMQAQAPAETLASELGRVTEHRDVVHQAVGMASAQLGVSVGEALIRLRAHAFADDRQLPELARDVIERRVRFDAATGSTDSTG